MADVVLVLTAPQPDAVRVAHAIDVTDGLGHSATKAECEIHLRKYLGRLVKQVEADERVFTPLALT